MYRRLEKISLQLEEHGLTHEKNYDMLLRRLTGSHNIAPLKTLVDVIEPVKIYQRRRLPSFAPLTRVVDAARPDAKVARKFRHTVDRFLADRSDMQAELEANFLLQSWEFNHSPFAVTILDAPILQEIAPLSEMLSEISKIGLEAIAFLTTGESASKDWLEHSEQTLEHAKQLVGEAELMVVSAIEKLVIELEK